MKKSVLIVPLLVASLLASCGEEQNPGTTSIVPSSTPSSSIASPSSEPSSLPVESQDSESSSSVALKEFTNVVFQNESFTYDGESHILSEVTGYPEGASVAYEGREAKTNVGSYKAKVTISKEGYKTLILEATLTILPAEFNGLSYDSKIIYYDGLEHINDIQLTGNQPVGTKVTQIVKNEAGQTVTSAIEVGVYSYEVKITNPNFNPLSLTAKLTIRPKKKDMPVFASSNGSVFFANGLHNSFLYRYDSTNGLKMVDTSSPKEIKKTQDGAMFIAKTPFINAAKQIGDNDAITTLYTQSGMSDFLTASDFVYYYSCSSLSKEKSGIYKVDETNNNDEPVITKIYSQAADNLTLYGNDMYFINKKDDLLYKLNLSSFEATALTEEKLHEFIIEGNKIYCSVNGTINDYIGCISISSPSSIEKLTNASGEYLTIKNNELYYNYVDWFAKVDSSRLGVWKINLTTKKTTQILNKGSVNGFDLVNSSSLFYIDAENYHLYRYNIANGTSTDLLDGFVAPEVTPTNVGGKTLAHGDTIYYLNMYAGKTLWAYKESSKQTYQVTTDKVMDYFIEDDHLYFNSVSALVNNDLFMINLKTSEEAIRISQNDTREMITDGTYIYSVHYNFAGLAGGLSRMKIDGSEYVKFSEVNNAKNLVIKDNRLYFINAAISNGDIEYIPLSSITSTSADLKSTKVDEDNIKNVKQFIIEGDNLFYIYEGTTTHAIFKTSLAALGKGKEIASSKTHPTEMISYGGYIYYYSHPLTISASSSGFYRVAKNATKDGTYELLAGYKSKYYATALAMSERGYLYFLNYVPSQLVGDAHTYRLNMANKTIEKVA